ncbi:MAG TPA: toxin TcdB middle/N-terminal domain-containing protein [Clostridia bacterium]|nr:toxin TcdB middle/N-terminal domain-containing protein [Clostridia bacterium]
MACHFVTTLLVALWFLCAETLASGADKSGVSPNTISLPKGPGSIEGLGESFQPTLNTGTAKYGIKLSVPPGTANHAPSLALQYEGGGGNGPLGFGWMIPTAYVQRRTDHGIPTYGKDTGFFRSDTFINDSKEELVPTGDGFSFCKNEGSFIRYRQIGTHWEGTAPDGKRMEFGLTSQGRIQDGANRIYSWMLERETDTRGNVIAYSYSSFPGEDNTNQIYLTAIRYGPGAPPWVNFHFVILQYEDRPDWFEDCRCGFIVRTGKRLKSIIVGTQGPVLTNHLHGDFDADGVTDNLVRRYDIEYLQYAGAASHWSLLASVTQTGADGISTLPPASFGYRICDPPAEVSAAGKVIGSSNTPPFLMDNPLADLVDLNGDGLPDILKTDSGGGIHTAYLNDGERTTSGVRSIAWRSGIVMAGDGDAQNFDLQSDEGTHLADMDGDGEAEFVVKAGPADVFYFGNRHDLSWGPRRQMTIQDYPPPAPFGSAGVRTADLDFDKRMDIIESLGNNLGYHIWFNLGNQSYSSRILAESPNGFSVDFNFPAVQIADMNGDRVPDIAWIRPTSVIITAGLGYGRFIQPATVMLPDGVVLTDQQINRAKLTDLNGDGLADLVIERAEGTDLWYWINLGTHAFAQMKKITGLPAPVGLNAAVRWADLNGSGTTDYILADRESDPAVQTIDLGELISCGATPNLLSSISNGIGRVTLIAYESSTKFRLEDAAIGAPWPDPMPFPVQVVSAVTNLDSLGHAYVTRFQYHDGYYDPDEKQFRGFARVDQIDEGDVSAPTLLTRSQFDTGRDFEVMKGRLLRLTTENEQGGVFSDEHTRWTLPPKTLALGTNGVIVSYTHPTFRTNVIHELGRGTERRLESEMDYDNFGNQTLLADYGIVEGNNRSAFNDERITSTEYAINTNAWLIRFPKLMEIKDANGAVISRTHFFYDDDTFSGSNLGDLNIGNLTMKREWVWPATNSAYIASVRTRYDSYGNPTTILDPLASTSGGAVDTGQGHVRGIAYDSRFHTYPITETIHIGGDKQPLVFQAGYDQGFGTITSSTDFNDNTTIYGYDGFARLTSIVKPGDTLGYPTIEYDYAFAVTVAGTGVVNYVETRQLDKPPGSASGKRDHYFISRQFVDGLGRQLMSKTEAEPASDRNVPRVVVNDSTQFNARQKPTRVLNPFFSLQDGTLDELLAFESIETWGWQGNFHNEGSLVALDLASAHATRTDYDSTLRPTKVTNADSTFRSTVYEPLLTRAFDENQTDPSSPYYTNSMVHYKDGLGRLIRVDEVTKLNDDGTPSDVQTAWATQYEYDLNDNLTRVTDSQNNRKWFQYDGLRRKVFMNDPDRGTMIYTYDDGSNLRGTVDAKLQHIQYSYDGVNRLLSEDYLDSIGRSPDVTYHYDVPYTNVPVGDGTFSTGQNTKGKLAWVQDLSGEEHTSYDARGRVESVIKRIPDPQFLSISNVQPSSVLVSYRTEFAYDSLDRMVGLTYPDNDEVGYLYNARNLLRAITGGVNGLTESGLVISNILYEPSQQLAQIDYGNGVRTTYGYDSRLRLKLLLTVSRPSTLNQQLINFTYTFDGVSNIKSISDNRPTSAVPLGDPRRNTQIFAYDDLYRITRATYNPATLNNPNATNSISYRYDRIGNMLAQISDIMHVEKGFSVTDLGNMSYGGPSGRANRVGRQPDDPPGPHALTGVSSGTRAYPYDANGNMMLIDGLTNTWDFKDRLIGVENSEMRAEYTYDYNDRRITKRVWSKTSTDLQPSASTLQPSTVLYPDRYFEVREHDAPTKYVWNGNTRVARVTGSLNTNLRVQRLRIWPGWNLCSLAVTVSAASLKSQIPNPQLFQWSPSDQTWQAVPDTDTLAAGTVLWLTASTNVTLTVAGAYSDPANRTVPVGADFLPSASLEAWNLKSVISKMPSASAWTYDAPSSRWLSWLPSPLRFRSDMPAFIAPGQAVCVRVEAPAQLDLPNPTLRIRYYHQDHLGSSSAISDATGHLVTHSSYLPFGHPRQEEIACLRALYGFTQKERDEESGLNYFEARFLVSHLARFASFDPLLAKSSHDSPQQNHPYSYSVNRPTKFIDPSGLDINDVASMSFAEKVVHLAGWGASQMGSMVATGFRFTGYMLSGDAGKERATEKQYFADQAVEKTTERGRAIATDLIFGRGMNARADQARRDPAVRAGAKAMAGTIEGTANIITGVRELNAAETTFQKGQAVYELGGTVHEMGSAGNGVGEESATRGSTVLERASQVLLHDVKHALSPDRTEEALRRQGIEE